MTRNEISTALTQRPVDDLWALFLGHVRILQPFWEQSVRIFAQRCDSIEKGDVHLATISSAFSKMDDWRFKRIPHIKAHRNEIDSAISFIRNKAIEKLVSKLRVAPAARNAAGALRTLLCTSCHGYRDNQLSDLVAAAIYNVAAVRVLFPFDLSDLTSFHPGHSHNSNIDPFVVMIERAGKAMSIEESTQRLFDEVDSIWEHIDNPPPLEFNSATLNEETSGDFAQLHYASMMAFHRRPEPK